MMLTGLVTSVTVNQLPMSQIVLAVVAFLLLSAREELAFRGYPLALLRTKFGGAAALIVTTLFFVAEHKIGGSSWTNAVIGAGFGSLLFGTAALVTKGLALPVGLHAGWNLADWARGNKGSDGLVEMVLNPALESSAYTIAMTCYVIVMASALLGLLSWDRWNNSKQ